MRAYRYAALLLCLVPIAASSQEWRLIKEVRWGTLLRDVGQSSPYKLGDDPRNPFAKNGRLTMYQRRDHVEYNLRAPNRFGDGCQKTFTPFGPDSPCDPHTHRFTVVSLEHRAVRLPGIDKYADRKVRVRWTISSDAPPSRPLMLVPIQFQYWHITNYRIMGCPPVAVDSSKGWMTFDCVIHLPTSEGTKVGPPEEAYTSAGLDFVEPRDVVLRVKMTQFYLQE